MCHLDLKKQILEETLHVVKNKRLKKEGISIFTDLVLVFIFQQETRMASSPTGSVKTHLGLVRPLAAWP